MSEVCPNFVRGLPELCPRFARILSEVCQEFVRGLPKLCPRFARIMSEVCPDYVRGLPGSCPKLCPNHKTKESKRFGQASSGRSTQPRKRSYQTAAAMPGEVAKRGSTRARCSTSGSRDYADSKDNACDARHGAQVMQKACCSEVRGRTAKSPFCKPVS